MHMLLVELGEAAMRLEELVKIANEGRDVVLVKDEQPVAKLTRYSGTASTTKGKGLLHLLRNGFPTPAPQARPVE
jgi:hypothetical protein